METLINIVLIVLYGLSILNFLFRFMGLGACHMDPYSNIQAKNKFFYSYVFFILMSLVMMYQFNPWFIIGVPVLPIVVFGVVYMVIIIIELIKKVKDKKMSKA